MENAVIQPTFPPLTLLASSVLNCLTTVEKSSFLSNAAFALPAVVAAFAIPAESLNPINK